MGAGGKIKKLRLELDLEILALDAHFDPVTEPGFQYRERHVYPRIAAKGFRVRKLQGPLARRSYVAPEAQKPNVVYLTGSGHGNPDTYFGDYYEPVFRIGGYNPQEVRGKIIHFVSCETARALGPDFVRNGCLAYFGYDENFTFHPAASDLFFACDSEIDLAFADGLNASQVYRRTIDFYNQNIQQLRQQGKLYVAAILEFDRDHLRAPDSGLQWGRKKARLEQEHL